MTDKELQTNFSKALESHVLSMTLIPYDLVSNYGL